MSAKTLGLERRRFRQIPPPTFASEHNSLKENSFIIRRNRRQVSSEVDHNLVLYPDPVLVVLLPRLFLVTEALKLRVEYSSAEWNNYSYRAENRYFFSRIFLPEAP